MHVDETNLVISFKLKDDVNAFTDLTDDLHRICQWFSNYQGTKKIISTACHLGKLKLAFTSPDVISTSARHFLKSRIDFVVLLVFELLKKRHLPVRQEIVVQIFFSQSSSSASMF